ncbi:MAG: response regulator [Candidatus Bathyarchaeota archaeon]|nr:response regulator [Candidatus Bathyarchaeota archaeon]MDD4324798.1 response regulator [Candidatus Bathyarchaeota archaeon]MDI9576752.1 response regulator [Thermoproteota archaeon]MDT8781447.1 response regulator [Candidatus Bathyarchaeota archaeon]NLD65397.1 response regulator [Thermoproteota archaeon]
MDKKPRILVVDDDETIRTTMKVILQDEGYIVDLAATGKEAVQKTQENSYNLALLDIRLPDIEGIELLKLLKDNVPRTRKIMVTGYPSMQNAITALNKNADAYLLKPVDVEKLLKTVKDQLQAQKEEQKFSEQKVAEFIESRVKEMSPKDS